MAARRRTKAQTELLEAIDGIKASALHTAATVEVKLDEHTRRDDQRFTALETALQDIGENVKSLLQTRSFTQGVWRAVTVVSGSVAAIVSLLIAWWKS